MDIALFAASILFIVVSFIPLLPSSHWVVRVWEFPRLQISVIIVILLLCHALNWTSDNHWLVINSLVITGLGISLLYQLVWILPYTPFYKKDVKRIEKSQAASTVSVLSSNVYMPNNDFRKLIAHVRNKKPDFLVTLESNEKWQKGISEIESEYPYRKFCALENLYGMHLYSKIPFEEATLNFLIEDDVPSMKVKIN